MLKFVRCGGGGVVETAIVRQSEKLEDLAVQFNSQGPAC